MTLSLKAVVLDKLAKENHFNNWKHWDWHKSNNEEPNIERAVELALAAKQVEVEKVVEEVKSAKLIQTGTVTASVNLLLWTYKKDKKFKEVISLREFGDWLEKRLLAKTEEKVLNNSKT